VAGDDRAAQLDLELTPIRRRTPPSELPCNRCGKIGAKVVVIGHEPRQPPQTWGWCSFECRRADDPGWLTPDPPQSGQTTRRPPTTAQRS
jgi:hypothetical protein